MKSLVSSKWMSSPPCLQGQPGRGRARRRRLVERENAVDRGLIQPFRDDIRLRADGPAGRLPVADLHSQERAAVRGPPHDRVGPRSATRRRQAAHLRPAGTGVRQGFSRHQNRRRVVAADVTRAALPWASSLRSHRGSGSLRHHGSRYPTRCDHRRRARLVHCPTRERRCRQSTCSRDW